MEITAKYFAEKTGNEPVGDDLERCNCKQAGEFGHSCCGWCLAHNLPVFQCGCINQKNNKQMQTDACKHDDYCNLTKPKACSQIGCPNWERR